jgi:hypothetical protein
MTTATGVQLSNEKLGWFFTDPASSYELAEVVRLTGCSRDDIQNWVRRGIIEPDETTPGRRLYGPVTVATIAVAARLRREGITANFAFMHAHIITKVALNWIAGRELDAGEMPVFEKDFRQHFALHFTMESSPGAKPSESGVELVPGVLHVHILHRSQLNEWFDLPHVGVTALHNIWLNLSETARSLKDRASRRLSKGDAP